MAHGLLIALVLGAGGLAAAGWWRLAGRAPAPAWRLAAAGGGFLSLAAALLPPLDRAAHHSFTAHMTQHLLLTAVAAPLWLLADPFAALLWGLPRAPRVAAGRWFRPGAPLRRLGRRLTAMPVAWAAHVAVVWLWHLPAAYDAAVADRLVHDLGHLLFFATAVLFWWPLIQPGPRLRTPPPPGLRVAYLVLAALQGALLGLLLAASPRPWYRAYPDLADQALGGLVMWGAGGAVDMLAVLVLLHRYLAGQDRVPAPAAAVGPAGSPPGLANPP